jgi:hypothetical protein
MNMAVCALLPESAPCLEAHKMVPEQIETRSVEDGFWFCGKLGRKRNTIRKQERSR